MRALHELPGNSEAAAILTLDELERWLSEYIVCVYHTRRHRGIATTPLQRWTASIFGDEQYVGRGAIDRPTDEERIRLDFLPFVERTVQPNGITIDGIQYYSDVLRRFIGATSDGQKRHFVFRSDPRDISVVHFWDPELCRYSRIPYRNTTYPPMSVWELRELRRKLHDDGSAHVDETAIFAAYARLRDHEARAASETKRARRARARRPATIAAAPDPSAVDPAFAGLDLAAIRPFEIEDGP